jgi:Fe-S cluster biogenesis protein NfuA/nitrite reductase/ring-hydroxylating ferredoxin subunit
MDDVTAGEQVGRVEALLEEVEALADPLARDKATEALQAVLELYGEGLERIVSVVAERDDGTLAEALAADELISHLLLLHDLHPVPLEERVRGALESVRPYLASHGGNVELLGVEDGVARLRLEGSCSGCPSSTMTLKLAIEDAIRKAAPDIDDIEAEGAIDPAPAPGLIQLETVTPAHAPIQIEPAPSWAMAGGIPEVPGGGPVLKRVSGEEVLFVTIDGSHYAYRPACPACGESLEDAMLEGAHLACPACNQRYDVRAAGRALDAPGLHLDPVPLLVDDSGLVKVALGSVAA